VRGFFLNPTEFYYSHYGVGWETAPQSPGREGAGGTSGTGRGVAVNGQGYTRVRSSDDPSLLRAGLDPSAVSGERPAGASRGAGSTASSSGDALSSGSTSGVSADSGYSAGGGGDSGRTAVPR
jgi:hypothetical protein